MPWPFQKKPEESPQPEAETPQSRSEHGNGDEFEDAARQAVGGEPAQETEHAQEQPQDRFLIKPEWAESGAKILFLPLAVKDHPAWRLTDEEARRVRPQIQDALQAVADRYAPDLLAKVSTRHPELFNLVAVLAVLYYQKWRFVVNVKQLEAAEAAKKAKAAETSASPRGRTGAIPQVGSVFCIDCGERFETEAIYQSHLPCTKATSDESQVDATKI